MSKKSTFFVWAISSLFIYGFAIIQAVACNTTPIGCSGYKTYTQGGWGANCSGNNPASYLQNNFATAFPNGITLGCTNKLKFTSATAVRNYLPQGGTAAAYAAGTFTNPTSGGGVFGGQLLALAINIQMDLAISSFASAGGNLKNLIITSGNFKNWTVQQFFDEANKKIGGCTAANFTFSQYSDVAAAINENYDNGSVNKGYLNCPALVASGVVTNVSCKCGNNGSITLTVSGGFPPYTFKWNNGSTSQNRTGLTAGNYSVTVKDKIGQSVALNFTVTQPSSSLYVSRVVTNVTTYGGSNGKVVLTVYGGTSPYTYLWSNGATTKDLTNVPAGSYSVTVTDAKGCKRTACATVCQPNPPLCNVSASAVATKVICNGGSTGSVVLTVTGGTSPFTYLWSNGATSKDLTNVPAGSYSVTVKDKNLCTAMASATVGQPDPLTTSAITGMVKCNGGSNGSVTLTVSGGNSPYSYVWSNGATTKDLTNVGAGSYSVTVSDSKGCTKTETAVVEQPDAMVATMGSVVDVNCYGEATGSIAIYSVTGGNGDYTFLWSNGSTSQDLTGIPAGTYTVTVTDSKGCTTTASATIDQPDAPLSASAVADDAKCNGGATGTVTLTVSGGTADYSYLWSNGATTKDLSGVVAGSYSVTVTDANGCTKTASATVGQPDALSASAVKSNVKCYDGSNGSVDLTVTGGTAEYSFLWSNGATTEDLTGVSAGSYSVTVTDANGCTTTASATVEQPDALSASTLGGVIDANCNGSSTGSVNLTVSGGTADYGFLWSNGATTEDLTGVPAGSYSVTVTDANGCTTTASALVSEPTPVSGSGSTTPTSGCSLCTGTATVIPSGGTAPYTYAWSNGATGSSTLSNLCAQSDLSVTVTDANGCSMEIPVGPVKYKEGCTAVEVVSYSQGLKWDYTPVDANRSNPNTMKGTPENTDLLGSFYALGFGGWAILRVDGSIVDKPGNDLRIVEVTWWEWRCGRYTEKAHIEISQDGVTWYDRGIICQDADIDIAPLPCISYVRITDVSDRADFVTAVPIADGFDVDGIICLQPSGVNGRGNVDNNPALTRDEDKPNFKAEAKKSYKMYPNPADSKVHLSMEGITEGQSVQVQIMDQMGRELKTIEFNAAATSHRQEINTEDLTTGMYIIQVKGEGINYTQKFVKK